MPLDQNPHQTVTRFGRVGFSMYTCGFSVPQMHFDCLHTRQDQNKLHLKRCFFFFCQNRAHLAKRKRIGFVRRKDKTNYLSNERSVTIHEISTS